MYDRHMRYIEQDDPPEPEQPHCPECGAFLSWEPTGMTKRLAYAHVQYTDEDMGVKVSDEEYEDVPYWQCKKCGKSHSIDAVFAA